MTKELPVLYLTVRLIKPETIVETGVSSGSSSAYILRALYDNQKGKLYSIDLPPVFHVLGGFQKPDTRRSLLILPKYQSSI